MALHLVSRSGGVRSIKLLLDKGMSFNLTDTEGCTQPHISAGCGRLEATNVLSKDLCCITKKYIVTPLMLAAQNGKM